MKNQTIKTFLTFTAALVLFLAAAPAVVNADDRRAADELSAFTEPYRRSGNLSGLAAALRSMVAAEPGRFDVRLELGETYIGLNRFPEAIQVLKEASAIIPADEAPHRLLARVYGKLGNDSLHGFHLVRAAVLAQRNWENQHNLAMYQLSRGRLQQAEQLLAKAMDINGGFAPAKFEYAKLMLERRNFDAAFEKFYEAHLAEPENARYQAYTAYAASLSGRTTVAREYMDMAFRSGPSNPAVHYVAALIHINKGDNKAAEQSLRTALRYSPTDAPALEALGDVLAADFRYGEACASYLAVWQTSGYSERVAFKLGKTLAYDGKHREAKDFLEAVVSRNPKHGEAVYRLADVYCELGDTRRAAAMSDRIRNVVSYVWFMMVLGRVHEAVGEFDQAREAYGAAHATDPRNAQVNACLGRLTLKQAGYAAAAAFYETAAALDPADMRNMIGRAKALEQNGNPNEAVRVYESVLARSRRHPGVYMAVAAIKEAQNDPAGAIRCLAGGLEANPRDVAMQFHLGKLYQATRQYERALDVYLTMLGGGRRITVNESNIEALRMIGHIYYTHLTDERKARDFFRRYVRAGGRDQEVVEIMRRMGARVRT